MEYGSGTEGYYKRMLELQDKLRKSEEERLILEEKFNEMMQLTRDAEHDRHRLMRHRYHKFIEEDKARQERNEQILQTLDKIESRARMLSAKTQRFKAFRKQYEAYIKRIYRMKPEQFSPQNYVPSEKMFARKKLFADFPENTETVEGKLAMLEQYLRDNFDNFPPELTAKSPINNNRLFEDQNLQRNGYYENSFDKLEPESEESEYNKYPRKKYEKPDIQKLLSPKKNELLGNTIEKELERLQNKEPVKQLQREKSIESKSPERVIQDYKEIVSKSEEKFGLRGESPVRKVTPKENSPVIFDNSTKLLNIEELKNITEVQKISPVQQENVESESENPVIKNYKQMLKSLNDEVSPNENNLNDTHLTNVIQDNTFERSKQEDISDRTEAPEDISLNLSSEPLPIEQIDEKKPLNVIKSVDNDVSIDESTIKEQLAVNLDNEQKLSKGENIEEIINSIQPTEVSEQHILNQESTNESQNYVENYPQETLENQNVYQEYDTTQQDISEGFDQQQYEPQYDQQQEYLQNQPDYQEGYDNKVENQTAYPEGYDQPNMPNPDYLETYDIQQNQQSFPEGFDQSQPEYQQAYDQAQQEYDQNQQSYDQSQQGYDQNQPGYDPQYYPDQQNVPDQQYPTEQQPVYQEGYDQQYDPSQYVPDQQYPQDPQYNADRQYQEYPDQQYQPEQYDQQYTEQQIQENVYSTEQEYLEGEQSIDKQYESEQNVQYEPEQYTENLAVQQQIVGDQPNSESTEISVTQNEVDNKPIVEKKLPNLANMLDTDTESIKQDTKVSNESDFDFSKS